MEFKEVNELNKLRKNNRKIAIAFFLGIAILLAAIILSLMSGSYHMSADRVIDTLLGNGSRAENLVIVKIRLPRMVIAIIVAFALSSAGTILQTISKNPLCEPGMMGINSGAALAVVAYITLSTGAYYDTLSRNKIFLMPLVAIFGACLVSTIIFLIAIKKGKINPIRLILVGMGVNAGINAIITYFELNMGRGDFNEVLVWTSGSLWGTSWDYIKAVGPLVLLLTIIVFCQYRRLDLLKLGDELATGLGLNVAMETTKLYILAILLSALATAVAGNIAFLGLIGPQFARVLVGDRHKFIIPLGGIISSIILIVADIVARNLFSPIEIPVGICVSMIGVPIFVYFLVKER
ncbi:FecCD family ABC transporter permease [Lachnospira multipara]|uniref:FecCD family ABC transporter permease n=1 Tax=Lachnospira multipara TaxID=28051 RepID=UPI0009DDDB19|nr:iron ABC transporter permease [Lachnospira multipara]